MAVNVKMGVDIGGFASGIKEGQQILRGLNAEMKASDAAFKATGNAEQKLNSQTKTLNSTLNVQKGIADQARQALQKMADAGVDPADTAYQKLYVTLMNAEAGASEAQAALNALGQGTAEAANGADRLTSGLNGISKKISLDQVIGGIDKITTGLENAAKKAVDLGKQLWDTIMDSARRADDTATMAQMYGIDLDTFQRMQKLVAGGMDTTVDSMLSAQDRLKRGIGNDTKAVNDVLKSLHIRMTELQDTGGGILEYVPKDATKLFWEAGQAILGMSDAFDKEAAAQKLFGRGWKELVPLFETYKTVEEYNKALEEQTVTTEESVRDLAELNDAVGKLESSWTTLKDEFLGAIAPALEKGATAISGLLDKLTEYLQSEPGQKLLEELGTAVSDLLSGIGDISAEDIVSNFSSLLGSLTKGLDWINQNGETVTGIIKGLAVAFAGLKISAGVLEFVKIIQGLKGLGGGAAAGAAAAKGGGVAAGATAAAAGASAAETLLDTKLSQAGATFNVLDTTWKLIENANTDGSLSRADQVRQWVNRQVEDGFMSEAEAEEFFKKNLSIFEKLGEDVTVPIGVKPEDGAAEKLAGDIGVVNVPVKFVPVGDPIEGPAYLPRNVGQPWRQHANGLQFVPYDGYLAMLHRGERVMTARENKSYTYNNHNYFGNVNLNNGQDIDALCNSIDRHNRRAQSGFGS